MIPTLTITPYSHRTVMCGAVVALALVSGLPCAVVAASVVALCVVAALARAGVVAGVCRFASAPWHCPASRHYRHA